MEKRGRKTENDIEEMKGTKESMLCEKGGYRIFFSYILSYNDNTRCPQHITLRFGKYTITT